MCAPFETFFWSHDELLDYITLFNVNKDIYHRVCDDIYIYIYMSWQDDLNILRIVKFHVGLPQGSPIPKDHQHVSIHVKGFNSTVSQDLFVLV